MEGKYQEGFSIFKKLHLMMSRSRIVTIYQFILLLIFAGIHSYTCRAQKLFERDSPLKIQLSGQIEALLQDRGEDPQYHEIQLTYTDSSVSNQPVSIPIQARVRGNFRRLKSNCDFPPILLNFSSKATKGTLFEGQNKVKLVMPCQGDKYVVREYLIYQLYNRLTPKSFKARLVSVELQDPNLKPKRAAFFYGILLEEEEQVAERNGMIMLERQLVRPEQTQKEDFLTMAVFEYLIGNTDWSVQYRQNVKLIAKDSLSIPITVPYDFDHAGIVSAPYALPAYELGLNSTRERRYRGYCVQDMKQFEPVVAQFNQARDDFYRIYSECPYLELGYVKATLKFLDDFYKTINDPKRMKSEFQYPCDPSGTGNVVIKGLKQ